MGHSSVVIQFSLKARIRLLDRGVFYSADFAVLGKRLSVTYGKLKSENENPSQEGDRNAPK